MTTFIKFEKKNCKACDDLGKYLENKGVNYEKIDAFNNPEKASKYKIMSVPVLIKLEDEKEVDRAIGFNPSKVNSLIIS